MSNKGRSTPRVVCCAIPIARSAGKVLVITSRKRPNHWVLPKGGWEPSDGVLEAAASREALEEAGVRGKITRFVTTIPSASSTYHFYELDVADLDAEWLESKERRRDSHKGSPCPPSRLNGNRTDARRTRLPKVLHVKNTSPSGISPRLHSPRPVNARATIYNLLHPSVTTICPHISTDTDQLKSPIAIDQYTSLRMSHNVELPQFAPLQYALAFRFRSSHPISSSPTQQSISSRGPNHFRTVPADASNATAYTSRSTPSHPRAAPLNITHRIRFTTIFKRRRDWSRSERVFCTLVLRVGSSPP